jgi:glutamate/aspartate transport system substrate-binding protein
MHFAPAVRAFAEVPASTIDRIRQTDTIRIGYSENSGPFSYRDDSGVIVGYSIDICRRVVDRLRRLEGLADVTIKYVPRTPSDRVILLREGAIDLECAASTNTAERRKAVAFSYPHFFAATKFVALKSSNLRVIADLAGRTATSTSGSIDIGQLNSVNRERNLNIAVVPSQNIEIGFQMVADGHLSAFVMDDVLLANLIAQSKNPSAFLLSDDAFSTPIAYGFMLRRDDTEFKNAVNTALQDIYATGEFASIYAKWFLNPMPPRGVSLNIPMSDLLVRSFTQGHKE